MSHPMRPYLGSIARRLPVVSRRVREAWLVIAGFTALTLVMTYPIARQMGEALPNDLGDPLLNTWILAWDADRLLSGLRGLWQAPIFFPYANTLTYSEHLLGIAVLTAPVQWLFGNPVLTYNVAFLLSYVLAGCGMYLLVKSLTGNIWGAIVAGVAFAFCPYRVAQVPHLQVLMSGWMPIALWAFHRYAADGRRSALVGFGAAFVLQGLSNGYYLYFFCVPVGIIVGDALIRARRSRARMAAELAIVLLIIAAAIAPVASVYYQVRREQGLVRQPHEMRVYSADLASYLHVDSRLRLWGGVLPRGKAEGELFAGATVMALAAVALATSCRRRAPVGSERGRLDDDRPLPRRAATLLYALVGVLALTLSLGPRPTAWGVPIVHTGPYEWLLAVVPGLDGLRVPARFGMVVFLAASVLAGIGVAHVLPRLARPLRAIAGALLVGLILAEGYQGPMPVVPLEPLNAADAAAYAWLAERPPGAVLELPVRGREPIHSLRFQYRTLQHRHPIVNGFSGYSSLLLRFLRGSASPLLHEEQMKDLIRGLRWIGVRYMVFHQPLFEDQDFGHATLASIREQAEQLEDVRTFGSTTVVQLRALSPPSASGSLREIPRHEFAARASQLEDRLPLAFDGDPNTRWRSGRRQSGDEWVEVDFGRPRAVARVRLAMERSLRDYPRHLRIESSPDGERVEAVLYDDAVLPKLLFDIAHRPDPALVDIDLPPNETRVLRLRQLGETRRWFWAIDELTLWERASAR
jgi:hypothetical protein